MQSSKPKFAKGCHDSQIAGYFRQEETIEIACRDFYWKGLTAWINDYVRSCDEYQHNKSPRHARFGLLLPVQVPYAAWTSISTDLITQLAESQGRTQIMVVVDRFTKMAHFIALEQNATAKDVANVFLREVWKCYAKSSWKDERVKLPYLRVRTSRKGRGNTTLQPRRWNHRSPAVAWQLGSPHPNQTSSAPYLEHRIRRGRPSDRILFAGYMSGDVRAPPEDVSVRSVRGAWSYSHWKIEDQKVVKQLTGWDYTS